MFFPAPFELLARERSNAMYDVGPDQTEVDILSYEIADEVLEAAAGSESLGAWSMFCSGIQCPG